MRRAHVLLSLALLSSGCTTVVRFPDVIIKEPDKDSQGHDATMPMTDAGLARAGSADSGSADGGSPDGGSPDGGPPDGGM